MAKVGYSEADLLALAGQRSFDRGTGYLKAVEDLAVHGNKVTASVSGTDDYLVVLTLAENGALSGACDCPYGQEGFFCKHCVAVGLAYLSATTAKAKGNGKPATGDQAGTRLQSWLTSFTRDELLVLVLDRLVEDEDWRHQLELRAASAVGDIDTIGKRLLELLDQAAFGEYGYVEEGESRRYAKRVAGATAVVQELIGSGRSADAVLIAELAIGRVAPACHYATDPAGVIWIAAAELMASHYEACMGAEVDQVGLADFIAGRTLSDDDMPPMDIARYRVLLGDLGVRRLRDRLTAALTGPRAQRASEALEDFLRGIGDTDALVAMLAANLTSDGLGQLRIARELESAGRRPEALAWAERGLGEATSPGQPLVDFVADRYLAANRFADALTVRRDAFAAARNLTRFEQLRFAAERAGAWPKTKQWALGLLAADADALRLSGRGLRYGLAPVLVDALISEGDVESAWAAAVGIATSAQWLRLADLVAVTRPADALTVYQREIARLKQETGDQAYERLASLLLRAKDCHGRLGSVATFDQYLRALRADQKRKRKLISVLDAHQLSPARPVKDASAQLG